MYIPPSNEREDDCTMKSQIILKLRLLFSKNIDTGDTSWLISIFINSEKAISSNFIQILSVLLIFSFVLSFSSCANPLIISPTSAVSKNFFSCSEDPLMQDDKVFALWTASVHADGALHSLVSLLLVLCRAETDQVFLKVQSI